MALFSRRHYEFVARKLLDIKSAQLRNVIAKELCVIFGADNPAFDPELFYANAKLIAFRATHGLETL